MKKTIDSSKVFSFQKDKLQLSEYSLFFILISVVVLMDYLSNSYSLSFKKYVIILIISFIIILVYNYNVTTDIIIVNSNKLIIRKKFNRTYSYNIKDITITEKRRFTKTFQKHYVLLLKNNNGRKFRINSIIWSEYYELKEMLIKLGAYYE